MGTARVGVAYGVLAYVLWGLFPLYFVLLADSSTPEILLHRYLWALPICGLIIVATRSFGQLRAVLRSPRTVGLLAIAATTLAITSGVYIYAVNSGQVIEASLGYFINPLVTVALGVLVLRERLRAAQWVAVGVGVLAVAVLTLDYGRLPWIALSLSVSFGLYGLVKKRVGPTVGAVVGLTTEALVLLPFVLAGLVAYTATGQSTFGDNPPWQGLLLASGGVAIIAPLLPFAAAARRVSLTTVGLLQYLTPVIQLLCGLLVLGEQMPPSRWIGFALVWAALGVLIADTLYQRRVEKQATVPEADAVAQS